MTTRPVESYRLARRCVWSRNLEIEEAKARYQAVKIQQQWVVTPGKQTFKFFLVISETPPFFTVNCKNSPSAAYVSAADLVRKDVDIFSKPNTSSKHILC